MRKRRLGVLMLTAVALTPLSATEVHAAKAVSCTDVYLLCLNDASQQEGYFYRTVREVECGAGYVGCVKDLMSGC